MSLLLLFNQPSSGGGITGSAAITLGSITASSASVLSIAGQASITLGAITSTSAATLRITGSAAITLGAVTTASAAALDIKASAPVTLGAVTAASQATLTIAGQAAITLGAITSSSASKLAITGTAAITLGDVSASGAGVVGSAPITGTAAITLGDITLSSEATIADPEPYRPSGFGGWAGPALQKVGDTRWRGVRRAREEARAAFDEVAATTPARRKKAAVRASEAVAEVARTIQSAPPTQQPQLRDAPAWAGLLDDLLLLQAELAGLAEQEERIRAEQAREMAERWAMIEREMLLEAAREEELMVVMALAL